MQDTLAILLALLSVNTVLIGLALAIGISKVHTCCRSIMATQSTAYDALLHNYNIIKQQISELRRQYDIHYATTSAKEVYAPPLSPISKDDIRNTYDVLKVLKNAGLFPPMYTEQTIKLSEATTPSLLTKLADTQPMQTDTTDTAHQNDNITAATDDDDNDETYIDDFDDDDDDDECQCANCMIYRKKTNE